MNFGSFLRYRQLIFWLCNTRNVTTVIGPWPRAMALVWKGKMCTGIKVKRCRILPATPETTCERNDEAVVWTNEVKISIIYDDADKKAKKRFPIYGMCTIFSSDHRLLVCFVCVAIVSFMGLKRRNLAVYLPP